MAQITAGTRTFEIVRDDNTPVSAKYFDLFVEAARQMTEHEVSRRFLHQLPPTLNKVILRESSHAPMSYGGITTADISISQSYWDRQETELTPDGFWYDFRKTVVHEFMHGSEVINRATADLLGEMFSNNPHLNDITGFGQFDTDLIGDTEHLFVFAGANVAAAVMDGADPFWPYRLRHAEEYFREQQGDHLGRRPTDAHYQVLSGLQESVYVIAPQALPDLLPLPAPELLIADGADGTRSEA